MQAPLGDIVRKMLLKKDTSKELMKHIILGSRFDLGDTMLVGDKKIKIVRITSFSEKGKNNTKR